MDYKKSNTYLAILFCFSFLFYLKPYHGIHHDSILYLGQMLQQWRPSEFATDLFFIYGSQSTFTWFPKILAFFLEYFSPENLMKYGTLFSMIFFYGITYFFIRKIELDMKKQVLMMLSIIILPSWYGEVTVLSYGESFFTARPIAEGIGILSLYFWFFKNKNFAIPCLILSSMLHPLQSIPIWTIIYLDVAMNNKKILFGAPIVALTICILFGFFESTKNLISFYDDDWWDIVKQENGLIFVSKWQKETFVQIAVDLFILWNGFKYFGDTNPLKKLSKILIIGLLISLGVSIVFVELLHTVLIGSIQVWRFHWIAHWFAMLIVPLMLISFIQNGEWKNNKFILFLAILVIAPFTKHFETLNIIALPLMFLFFISKTIEEKNKSFSNIIFLMTLTSIVLITLLNIFFSLFIYVRTYGNQIELGILQILLSYPIVIFSLYVAWEKINKKINKINYVLVSILIVVSFLNWDQRTDWTKSIERNAGDSGIFGHKIEPGSQILWEDEVLAPWLILNRASYFNPWQMAGSLFNRETAINGSVRGHAVKALNMQRAICENLMKTNKDNIACKINKNEVKEICEESKGKLNYIVFNREYFPEITKGKWSIKNDKMNEINMEYYLYSCKDF